jgi:hypothetical protein
MHFFQQAVGKEQVWVRRVEHLVLRLVSLGFSLASAHAIRWFFAPLDGVDALQPVITWTIAIGFGVLGYFVSRGLAHRLMNHERIRAYAPICVVVEVVEIFCNYALAAAVIQRANWLQAVPLVQRSALTVLTYVVLSIIPLVSLLLAVVDMDLERSKQGGGHGIGMGAFGVGRGSSFAPPWSRTPAQPKQGSPNPTSMPAYPTYGQGYSGVPVASPSTQQAQVGGNGLNTVPFPGKRPSPVPPASVPVSSSIP